MYDIATGVAARAHAGVDGVSDLRYSRREIAAMFVFVGDVGCQILAKAIAARHHSSIRARLRVRFTARKYCPEILPISARSIHGTPQREAHDRAVRTRGGVDHFIDIAAAAGDTPERALKGFP